MSGERQFSTSCNVQYPSFIVHQNYIVFQWSFDAQLMTSTVYVCSKSVDYTFMQKATKIIRDTCVDVSAPLMVTSMSIHCKCTDNVAS